MIDLREKELSYMAAMFDAEGYACIIRAKPPSLRRPTAKYELRVGMTMTHADTIRHFFKTFGGSMSLDKRRPKLKYVWHASQILALRCLNTLAPELRIKHEQAQLAARFMATFSHDNVQGRKPLSAELVSERVRLGERMGALNNSHWYRKRLAVLAQ